MSDPLFNDPLAHFRLERHGPVIELVLARPARHNALDADLMQGLLDCLDELAHGQPLADRPRSTPAPLTRIARTPGCWPT